MEHYKQYDKIGTAYINEQENFFGNADWSREMVLSRIGIIEGKIGIDAGCGHGVETRLLLASKPKEIFAFDTSLLMLKEAKERTQEDNVHFIQGNFLKIPIAQDTADFLVACFSLHYVADIDAAYREIHRVLKKEGKAIIVVPHPEHSKANSSTIDQNGLLQIPIYDNKVIVKYPTHTIAEYYSTYAKKNFETIDIEERILPDVSEAYPSVLAFTLIKK